MTGQMNRSDPSSKESSVRPLEGHQVRAWGRAAQGALARFFESLGAQVIPGAPDLQHLADASFLIEDLGLDRLETCAITRAAIEKANPALVHVSVTAFGSRGPRALWKAGELVVSAMGGVLRLTGDPDRPPVKEALDACLFHADMVAAAGAMAAHYSRGRTSRGQHVDVAAQEVAFSRNINGVLVWQFDRRQLHRVGGAVSYGKATVRCIWRLADGWCFHSLMTGGFGAPANQALSQWMNEVGARNPMQGVDWLRYNRSTLESAARADWEDAMAAFFVTRTRDEIRGEGRRRGLNACVLATPADVLSDSQLQSRAFWSRTSSGLHPAWFAVMRAGPQPGHPPRATAESSPAGAQRGPLAGVRVLDFSWALVGSITTKILGDLGADVIKVESRRRPCLSRLDVQVAASSAKDLDDKPWFAHLNTSKRSLALDLKRTEARELLDPLIRWADVVVENFSPGTMAKLGLDYDALVRINPQLVMASGSVYGQTGPLAQEWGIDGTGAALSSRTYMTGWPDRDPVTPGAVPYGDVIVPYVMVAQTVAALQCRRQTGRGAHIDASMYEICAQQMWPAIAAAQSGLPPARLGNADTRTYWQGVLPASGTDRWVAVTINDATEWAELMRLTAGAAPEVWSATQSDLALAETLQRHGIAAGMVQDMQDLVDRDPGIAARGALIRLDHVRLGAFAHIRTPMSFSHDVNHPYRAPALGEHTHEIAHSLGELPQERVQALQRQGIFE
jgi:crotonobetainyl-CoA:carnitine CoA-transferase CaiB-like acyl-CoA transferase